MPACYETTDDAAPMTVDPEAEDLTRGLEPPRVAPYGPEPYASANSAT